MKRVSKDASVHEKTVVKAAANLDEMKVRRSTRQRSTRRKKAEPSNGQVNLITMHPDVWATALELAGGDRHRLQVVGPENVLVHNNRAWKDA